ncbi:MAG: ABC transporter substrate-binding protein [Thermodesulfobacteriota bacterium]|nr:ABC transporter substrate-binding protein [Thermodesulfobacteriota bacterium]
MKRFAFICLILILIGMISGIPLKVYPKKVKPVKIGIILCLSGPASMLGRHGRSGIEFVIDEINKQGGIKSLDGATIEYIVTDDKTLAATSVSEYERLVTAKKVIAVVGPCPAASQKATYPYAERYRVPLIGFGGGVLLKEPYRYGRNLQTHPLDIVRAMTGAIVKTANEMNLPLERIALLSYDVGSGPVARLIIPEAFKKVGVTEDKIVFNDLFSAKAEDLRPSALKMKTLNIQAMVGVKGVEHEILWAKACHGVDYFPLIYMGTTGIVTQETWDGLGDKLAKETISRPGWFGLGYFHPEIQYQPLQDFLVKFRDWAKLKGLPEPEVIEPYNVLGAQAMYFLYRAIEIAGSRKPSAINTALWKLSLKEGDPHLIAPQFLPELKFDFTTNYPKNRITFILFWDDTGKLQVAYPKEMRTAPMKIPDVK